MKNYDKLIENLKNTAFLYFEDRNAEKDTTRIKSWLKEIIKTLELELKYTSESAVIETAYKKLEELRQATKSNDLALTRRKLYSYFNTFTLACWVLTTAEQIKIK